MNTTASRRICDGGVRVRLPRVKCRCWQWINGNDRLTSRSQNQHLLLPLSLSDSVSHLLLLLLSLTHLILLIVLIIIIIVGARHVTCVERWLYLAMTAKETLITNGYDDDHVKVIYKRPSDIQPGTGKQHSLRLSLLSLFY